MAVKKILWIEDDEDIVISFKLMLEEEGWDVYTELSVEEGEKAAENVLPDLIIMDIMMETTHGFTGIESFKGNPQFKDTPIIIYSGVTKKWGETTATREDGLLTEAEEFVDKADGPEILIRTIRKYLSA